MLLVETLEISNFKSVKHLKLRCRRINVFIGKPNTGKSNILESIGLLSHVYYGDLKGFVRLENMLDLFYDKDPSEEIVISAEMPDHPIILRVRHTHGFIEGIYSAKEMKVTAFRYEYSGRERLRQALDDLSVFKFYRFRVRESFPSNESRFLRPPSGDNLLVLLMANRQLRRLVRDILEEYGLRLVLRPLERRIEVEKEYEDIVISYPYSLLSDTLQRLIFHLLAVESNRDSVIAFEEPEAHSFPYYTKFLAERIALDRDNQYFISTHNPYLLLSLLEKASSSDIAVFITYYEDYQTKVRELSEEEKEEILGLELDVFFNIDRLLGEPGDIRRM